MPRTPAVSSGGIWGSCPFVPLSSPRASPAPCPPALTVTQKRVPSHRDTGKKQHAPLIFNAWQHCHFLPSSSRLLPAQPVSPTPGTAGPRAASHADGFPGQLEQSWAN